MEKNYQNEISWNQRKLCCTPFIYKTNKRKNYIFENLELFGCSDVTFTFLQPKVFIQTQSKTSFCNALDSFFERSLVVFRCRFSFVERFIFPPSFFHINFLRSLFSLSILEYSEPSKKKSINHRTPRKKRYASQ